MASKITELPAGLPRRVNDRRRTVAGLDDCSSDSRSDSNSSMGTNERQAAGSETAAWLVCDDYSSNAHFLG